MTELLKQATDDQIALAICAGGVFASGLIMYFSYHVGRLAHRVGLHDETAAKHLSFPAVPAPVSSSTVRHDKAA